jgi:lipoprotein NlpI
MSSQRASALVSQGNLDAALREFEESFRWHAECPKAFCSRAAAFVEMGEYELAIQDCNNAIKLKPDLVESYCNRAAGLLGIGDTVHAIEDCERAIQLRPEYYLSYNNRGFAFAVLGNYGRALEDLDRAILLEPSSTFAFRNRATLAFCLRDFSKSKNDCTELLRLDPKDLSSAIWMCVVARKTGVDGTVALRERTHELNLERWPGPLVRYLLGSRGEGAVLADVEPPNQNKRREQECEAFFIFGESALARGDQTLARKWFKKAIATGAVNCMELFAARSEMSRLEDA